MAYNGFGTLDRREFLAKAGSAGAALALTLGMTDPVPAQGQSASTISLPPLPYAQDALAPAISGNTMSFHYGKHHQAYVNNTVKMVTGTELEKATLEEIIKKTAGRADQASLFNNAAQVFNHTFYWHSMKPGGGGEPSGKIAEKISESFGSYQKFVEAFSGAAASQFGSGWAWLVVNKEGALEILQTSNAANPVTEGKKPILTCDVWEHAYYLDKQNLRPNYISDFWNLVDWDAVAGRL